ncbi:MAG: ATP-binding protein [Oligoflexales bacterium]
MVVLTYATCIDFVAETNFGRLLRFKISTSSEYYVKRYLKKSPKLSKKIKIFAFSDKDLATLKRSNLFIHEWANLLEMLATREPKLIFIDKIFSFLTDPNKKIKESIELIENIESPIVVGAFLSKNKINYRREIDLDKYSLMDSFLHDKFRILSPIANMKRQETGFFYGPNAIFSEAFSNIGTLNYNGQLTFSPFVLFKDNYFVPHAAMLVADSVSQRKNQIYINQTALPIDSRGNTLINLLDPKSFYRNVGHLSSVRAKLNTINKGDTIIILPEMYTGGTDFHDSPYGYIPGGIFITSIVNSIITNSWINSAAYEWLYITTWTAIGFILALNLSSFFYWLATILIVGSIVLSGLASFAYMDLIIPWFWSIIGFTSLSIVTFAYKSFYWEKMAKMLKMVEQQKKELAEKATSLSIKTNDLNTLLSNINQGILTIMEGGVIHHEYSEYCKKIFEIDDITLMSPTNLLFSYSDAGSFEVKKTRDTLNKIIGENYEAFVYEEKNLVKEINRSKSQEESKTFEINWQPIIDSETQKISKLMIIVKDITHMRQTQTQIAEIVKWQALIDMANGIAHEINNPLAIIDGLNSHICHFVKQEEVDRERILNYSEKLKKATSRISNIVTKMQSFTLKSSTSEMKSYSVESLLNDLLYFCNSQLVYENIELSFITPPKEVFINCIKSSFIEAMLALIYNAKDALDKVDTKWIKITVAEKEEFIHFIVADNGTGVPEKLKETLFNPFVTGKPVGSGVGLGLFTAKNIFESIGGNIKLLQDATHTSFEIQVPIDPKSQTS